MSSPLFGCFDFGAGTGNHLRSVPLRVWEYFQILTDLLSQVKMSTLKCGAVSSYLQCETVPIGGEAKETNQVTKTMKIKTGCRPHCMWPSCVYSSVLVNEAFTWAHMEKKKKKRLWVSEAKCKNESRKFVTGAKRVSVFSFPCHSCVSSPFNDFSFLHSGLFVFFPFI